MSWINERYPLASSTELGQTLMEVQNLQKKHSVLENELSIHSPVIDGVMNTAQELIAVRHFASDRIQKQKEYLLESWTELQEMVTKRSEMLNDSLQAQQVRMCTYPHFLFLALLFGYQYIYYDLRLVNSIGIFSRCMCKYI